MEENESNHHGLSIVESNYLLYNIVEDYIKVVIVYYFCPFVWKKDIEILKYRIFLFFQIRLIKPEVCEFKVFWSRNYRSLLQIMSSLVILNPVKCEV